MNSKDVATAIRKDDSLVVHRLDTDIYWAGSTYALVKMDLIEFNKFRDRYNGYKDTPNIPQQIEIDKPIGYIKGEWKDKGPDVHSVIQEPARHDDLKSIFITDFSYTHKNREIILYIVNEVVGGYDHKYNRIIKQFSYCMSQNDTDIIRAYDRYGLKAVITPVRLTACDFSSKFAVLLNAELPDLKKD